MKTQNTASKQQRQTQTHDPQSLLEAQAGITRLRALAQDHSDYRDYLSALCVATGERLGWDAPEVTQLERRIADAETQRQRVIDLIDLVAQLEAALLGRSA